jgi:hypothetical protein
MRGDAEASVHTMSLDALRVRVSEARRLLAQARAIARASFEVGGPPQSEVIDAPRRVGFLLDAAQRLLPGIAPLTEERLRSSRGKSRDTRSRRRVTLRAGAERAMQAVERAQLLEAVEDDAAGLVAEIERRSSSAFRAACTSVPDDGTG